MGFDGDKMPESDPGQDERPEDKCVACLVILFPLL